ncbi:MAG TPA: branched-chain amino acid ABC transporter permease [Magnetospirillaceae bacterium]|jgi:branched-chain amino acid transport system permease protein
MNRVLRALWPVLSLMLLVAAIAVAASGGSEIVQRQVTYGLIELIAVVALYIFVGNSGLLSFGNVSFMAIGAYVSALLTMRPASKGMLLPGLPELISSAQWPVIPAAIAGGLVASAFAFLAGIPLMRLSGIAASIATFAVLEIVYIGAGNWTDVTGGQNSLIGLPIYSDIWVCLIWSLITIATAFIYQETRSGLLLRASREDIVAARAAGVNVHRHRLVSFVISAFFSGIAGVLLGHFLGTVRIETFYLDLTFAILAMLVVGGMGSLAGAVIGAIVIAVLTEALRRVEAGVDFGIFAVGALPGLGDAVLALAMLLIILFRPKGLSQGREITWPFRAERPSSSKNPSESLADGSRMAPRPMISKPES